MESKNIGQCLFIKLQTIEVHEEERDDSVLCLAFNLL